MVQVAGTAPVLVYDTVGHAYKIDYQPVLAREPGASAEPDSIAVLRITLGSGKVDTVAQLAGPEFGEAVFGEQTAARGESLRPQRFLRRAAERGRLGGAGTGEPGGLARRGGRLGRGASNRKSRRCP